MLVKQGTKIIIHSSIFIKLLMTISGATAFICAESDAYLGFYFQRSGFFLIIRKLIERFKIFLKQALRHSFSMYFFVLRLSRIKDFVSETAANLYAGSAVLSIIERTLVNSRWIR